MIEKLHIIIALFAALAITILSLFQDITFYALSIRLVFIIPVFFIIGLFLRSYLKKLLTPKEEPKEEETDNPPEGDEESGVTEPNDVEDEDYD